MSKDELNILKLERKRKTPIVTSGGKITGKEIRRLLQEIEDDEDPEDDYEKELVLVVIPTMWDDGRKEVKVGVYDYNVAKQMFGDAQLKSMIESARGMAGAHLMTEEDLADMPSLVKNKPLVEMEG